MPIISTIACALGLCGIGCTRPVLANSASPSTLRATQEPEPAVLAAQGSHLAGPDGSARVWVVFDRPLDPTTLRAFNFVLVFDDDSRSYPSAVHLAGADLGFDARSIVLEGEFIDPEGGWTLARVQIVGAVYSADGGALRGGSVAVASPAPPRAVAARRLPPGPCPGGSVRVYFSDAVEASSSVELQHQTVFRRASNRLDLCPGPTSQLRVQEGLVIGSGHQSNAAATLRILPFEGTLSAHLGSSQAQPPSEPRKKGPTEATGGAQP